MTTTDIFRWFDVNLKPHILEAMQQYKQHEPNLIYTIDWLIAIASRESEEKVAQKVREGLKPPEIWAEMKGDYSQRHGEDKPQYHGFSNFQIDIDAFPDWVNSGAWKDPTKAAYKCIAVLESKRNYLERCFPKLGGDELYKAITAAYNAGEGNIAKAIKQIKSLDIYTTEHNYSNDVWRRRGIYNLMEKQA